jgi:uncharacterized membrane protein YcfT
VRPASTTRWDLVAAALPMLLAAAVYWPITRSYFYADDFVHLASVRNDPFLRFVLRPFAGHNYVVRNLVFYAQRGSPRMRCAMTLRWISDVPPMIVSERA